MCDKQQLAEAEAVIDALEEALANFQFCIPEPETEEAEVATEALTGLWEQAGVALQEWQQYKEHYRSDESRLRHLIGLEHYHTDSTDTERTTPQ